MTGCLGQGEACIKAAIQLIGQSPACLEEKQVAQQLPSLLSTLLAVPDSPDRGPLHLARAALNAVNKFPWSQVFVLQQGKSYPASTSLGPRKSTCPCRGAETSLLLLSGLDFAIRFIMFEWVCLSIA